MIYFSLRKKLHTSDGEMQLHITACNIEQREFISLYTDRQVQVKQVYCECWQVL